MWCSWRAISYPTPHKFIFHDQECLPLNWSLRYDIWGKWRTNFGKTEDLDGQRIALQCGSGSPPKFRPSFSTALTLQVSRGNGLKFAEWLRLKKFVCKAKCMYQGRKNAEKKKTRRQIIAKSTIVRRNPNAIERIQILYAGTTHVQEIQPLNSSKAPSGASVPSATE